MFCLDTSYRWAFVGVADMESCQTEDTFEETSCHYDSYFTPHISRLSHLLNSKVCLTCSQSLDELSFVWSYGTKIYIANEMVILNTTYMTCNRTIINPNWKTVEHRTSCLPAHCLV